MIQKKSVLFSKILYMSFVLFMILENVLRCPNVYKMCIIICNIIYSENRKFVSFDHKLIKNYQNTHAFNLIISLLIQLIKILL